MKRLALSLAFLLGSLALYSSTDTVTPQGWENAGWDEISSMEFSPDSKTLAVGFRGRVVRFCAKSGEALGEIASTKWTYPHYSPDGKWLVVRSEGGTTGDGEVQFFTSEGEPLTERVFVGGGRVLEFSPDSNHLAMVTSWRGGYRLALYDRTGKEIRHKQYPSYVNDISFSPNGKSLAVGGTWDQNYGVEILGLKDFKMQSQLVPQAWVSSLCWMSKNRMAITEKGGNTKIWDTKKKEPTEDVLPGDRQALTAKRRYLVATGGQPSLTWDVKRSEVVASNWDAANVDRFSLAKKGRLAAGRWVGKEKYVIWDIRSGKTVVRKDRPGLGRLTLSPDGKSVAISHRDGGRWTLSVGPPK